MDIKDKILELIKQVYSYQGTVWAYNGKLKIEALDPVGYKVIFGLNNQDKPLIICAELPDNKFLKYMEKELRTRQFNTIKWFIGTQTLPDNSIPMNKNGCNNER